MPVQVMRFSIDGWRAQLTLVPLFWSHRNRCSLSMQLYVVPFIKFCVGIAHADTLSERSEPTHKFKFIEKNNIWFANVVDLSGFFFVVAVVGIISIVFVLLWTPNRRRRWIRWNFCGVVLVRILPRLKHTQNCYAHTRIGWCEELLCVYTVRMYVCAAPSVNFVRCIRYHADTSEARARPTHQRTLTHTHARARTETE